MGRDRDTVIKGTHGIYRAFRAQPSSAFHVHKLTGGGVGWRCLGRISADILIS